METRPRPSATTEPKLNEFMQSCYEISLERYGAANTKYPNPFTKAIVESNPELLNSGYRNEALFYACVRTHSPFLEIEVSNQNQDRHGIDFYIDDAPLDVTANLGPKKMVRDACRNADYFILFLPPSPLFTKPFKQDSRNFEEDTLYYKLFLNNKVQIKSFFEHTYTINIQILETIKQIKTILANTKDPQYSQKKAFLREELGGNHLRMISETDYSVFDGKIEEVNCILGIIDSSIPSKQTAYP